MLAHTGLFEKSDFQFNIDDFTPSAYTESLWNEWKEQESLRRLVKHPRSPSLPSNN